MTLLDKVMQLRRHVIQRAAAGIPVTRVCREVGISRALFYRWKQRYLRSGDAGLAPRPALPRRWGRQSPPALEHAVLAYALHCPTHGPARIADQLRQRRYGGWRLSATGPTRSCGATGSGPGGSGWRGSRARRSWRRGSSPSGRRAGW